MCCFHQIVLKVKTSRKQFDVQDMYWTCNSTNKRSSNFLKNWYKNEGFWQRITCTAATGPPTPTATATAAAASSLPPPPTMSHHGLDRINQAQLSPIVDSRWVMEFITRGSNLKYCIVLENFTFQSQFSPWKKINLWFLKMI